MLSPLVVAVLAASTVLAPASQSVGAAAAAASAGARDDTPEAETILATAPISEVTLYQGRAMISRTEKSPAREGLFEIRFERLPPALDASSLQATVRSDRGGAKLLDVRFEETVTQADVTNKPPVGSCE